MLVKANAAFNTTGDVVINDIETVNLTADRGTATTATTHTVAALAAAAATTVAVKGQHRRIDHYQSGRLCRWFCSIPLLRPPLSP